jgi:hypothetical protein
LLTAVGYPPGGSSTVHIYTQTVHRTTQNKQYIEQHNNFGRVLAVPHLCRFYPGICLTTEEKARKNHSEVSRRVPAGTMKIHTHTIKVDRMSFNGPYFNTRSVHVRPVLDEVLFGYFNVLEKSFLPCQYHSVNATGLSEFYAKYHSYQ